LINKLFNLTLNISITSFYFNVNELCYKKAPLEQLKKNFRLSQKHIEKEMMRLNQSIIDITTKESQHKIDSQEAKKLLEGLVIRLKSLKKKVTID